MSRVRSRPTAPIAGSASSTVRIPVRRALRAPSTRHERLVPTVARWPLDLEPGAGVSPASDAAVAVVRRSLENYRAGRADRASRTWDDEITWAVRSGPPAGGQWVGAEGVFAYHALLERLSQGTFRQRLIALEGSRGSIVDAYLRTTATRRGRRLDIPTLAVFELSGGCVFRVTEVPGDNDAWEAFWAG